MKKIIQKVLLIFTITRGDQMRFDILNFTYFDSNFIEFLNYNFIFLIFLVKNSFMKYTRYTTVKYEIESTTRLKI